MRRIPPGHICLGYLRAAESLIAVRVQGADLFFPKREIAAGQLGGGGAAVGSDENSLRSEAVHRAPDLPAEGCGFAGSGRPEIPELAGLFMRPDLVRIGHAE